MIIKGSFGRINIDSTKRRESVRSFEAYRPNCKNFPIFAFSIQKKGKGLEDDHLQILEKIKVKSSYPLCRLICLQMEIRPACSASGIQDSRNRFSPSFGTALMHGECGDRQSKKPQINSEAFYGRLRQLTFVCSIDLCRHRLSHSGLGCSCNRHRL